MKHGSNLHSSALSPPSPSSPFLISFVLPAALPRSDSQRCGGRRVCHCLRLGMALGASLSQFLVLHDPSFPKIFLFSLFSVFSLTHLSLPLLLHKGTVEREVMGSVLDQWGEALRNWDSTTHKTILALVRRGVPDALRHQVLSLSIERGVN